MNVKYCLLLVVSIFLSGKNYAHDPHEAFFSISQTKDTVKIKAQFPWTLRNALIQFSPDLSNAKSSQDFERAFVEYVKKNIIITDITGETMPFIHFEAIESSGHSHESNYLLFFYGQDISKIRNSLMFNHSDRQTNYHSLSTQNNKNVAFQTSPKHPIFVMHEASSFSFSYGYLCLFIALGVYYLCRIKNRK